MAAQLGADFEEVPTNDEPEALWRRLFGGSRHSWDTDGAPTIGLLGRDGPTVLYLSGLDMLPQELAQDVRAAIAERRYADAQGTRWTISDDLVIIASRGTNDGANISADHWLWTAFDQRMDVTPPSKATDVLEVANSILADLGHTAGVDGDDPDCIATLVIICGATDHLKLMRRVLETAGVADRSRPVHSQDILLALSREARWLVQRVQYRGALITEHDLNRWIEQFPASLRPVAFQIFKMISTEYYIGAAAYHDALRTFILHAGINEAELVSFCKWQNMGTSAPRMAHALKNQAGWNVASETDLTTVADNWPTFADNPPKWFVVVDDMIGTGGTMRRLTRGPQSPLVQLLNRFPDAQVRIFVIVGFEDALRQVSADLRDFKNRVEILAYRLLGEADRCFTDTSRILPNQHHRDLLRDFCNSGAAGQLTISARFRLGFQQLATVVVFEDTVPNTTIPLLWYRCPTWQPLFPASDP